MQTTRFEYDAHGNVDYVEANAPGGKPRSVTVETAAAEGGAQVRARALTGLRWAGDDRSRGVIEAVVADPFEDAGLRRHGATLLGELANPESEAVLGEALSEMDRGIRHTASTALGLVFPQDETHVNMARIRSPHADVAEPAASFLARHGDPTSLLGRLPHAVKPCPVRRRGVGVDHRWRGKWR